ncbi:hypothetical protein H0H92_015798 [Tricholoma furcatifolium]|nr:hypothetical protein H0H92_015798 [Tricholoma furcatifolium]
MGVIWKLFAPTPQERPINEEHKKIYALEELENFRWIFKLLATCSSHPLTGADRVSPDLERQLAELGEFAEISYMYNVVPLEFLFHNVALLQPGFPLEGYHALEEATLVSSVQGNVGHLPAMVVYRSSTKQLLVVISGTSSMELALHDLRVLLRTHPSHRGQVHSGFWALYCGLKPMIFDALKRGLEDLDVAELVITGHSMGGSIGYLFCMDLLLGNHPGAFSLPPALKVTIAVFGVPRAGDAGLVEYWRELVANYRRSYGSDKLVEYSVKAYNDGYRHFAAEPLYLDDTRLYHTPQSECEHALFNVIHQPEYGEGSFRFPKGGHNYYNARDFERLLRRMKWLQKANINCEGWEGRYREHSTQG